MLYCHNDNYSLYLHQKFKTYLNMSAKKGKWTERFNQKNDFDFTVSRVTVTRVAYARVTKLIPITKFSLFGITVTEAMKIAGSFNTLADHVCMITLIEE